MSAYPVVYHQTPAIERSRLTVFFRLLIVIPHLIWSFFYGLGAGAAVFVAWFATVFTGRYPAGLYEFVAGYLRFTTRLYAYMYLVTDQFPPFDGGEHPEYPVKASIPAPQASYNRLTTALRIFLLIPVMVLLWIFGLWIQVLSIVLWFVAVVSGRTSAELVGAGRIPLGYLMRAYGYAFLLTDRWPPLED